jgi:hypothetical protein
MDSRILRGSLSDARQNPFVLLREFDLQTRAILMECRRF